MAENTGKRLENESDTCNMINVKVFPGRLTFLHFTFLILYSAIIHFSCSTSRQISRQAGKIFLADTSVSKGHTGISIYEPATGKFWFDYNAEKYFIPASNTKLFTLYAGMKYIGDSLTGLRYLHTNDTIYALPAADPTFMHPGFTNQPVIKFLDSVKTPIIFSEQYWNAEKYGNGWAWDDYNDYYMAERNAMPVNGNLFNLSFNKNTSTSKNDKPGSLPNDYLQIIQPKIPGVPVSYKPDNTLAKVVIIRKQHENDLSVSFPDKEFSFRKNIPFVTDGITTALKILHQSYPYIQQNRLFTGKVQNDAFKTIKTQPSDSLFKMMMHESDNFFAEQTLLMASNEFLGYMTDEKMIAILLNESLNDVPQKPKWVDGSGLSRYNLFTPRSFVYILNKLKVEFGMERLKQILPTGGEGTLKNHFKSDAGYIFAKTGSLSNNSSLSGFLVTKKGKLLIFSVLANNYPGRTTPALFAAEHFLTQIRENF